jgi:hypothetical protein
VIPTTKPTTQQVVKTPAIQPIKSRFCAGFIPVFFLLAMGDEQGVAHLRKFGLYRRNFNGRDVLLSLLT